MLTISARLSLMAPISHMGRPNIYLSLFTSGIVVSYLYGKYAYLETKVEE